jgi:hypothetical protein
MQKLIMTLLMVPALAFAQTNNVRKFDAYCVTADVLGQFLMEHGEEPVFRGISNRDTNNGTAENPVVFYFNKQTMSWSMVERIGQNTFCVIGTGTDINFINDNNRQNRRGS